MVGFASSGRAHVGVVRRGWATDVLKQLKLEGARVLKAPYGTLPPLGDVDFARDVIFTWNGTTSGVRVPDGNWIPADRKGLTICDATSAASPRALRLPWEKLDVVTWSWQKVLGGEEPARHAGARARARWSASRATRPKWPLPKIFRMTERWQDRGEASSRATTINTPSMLRR